MQGVTLRLVLALCFVAWSTAQEPAKGIFVTYTEPGDAGQAERVREIAARMKPFADQLEDVPRVEIHLVHTARELAQRAGGETAAVVVPSYVHSGFFLLSPLAWQRNPTPEAIEHEVKLALVRYAISYVARGNNLPAWLEQGLLAYLTGESFAPLTAGLTAQRAQMLLTDFAASDPASGYWAVRYLVEERGGLTVIKQLLRLVAQRPDLFVDNLQLVYGLPVGELERAWRAWCQQIAAAEERKQRGIQVGPLPPKPL